MDKAATVATVSGVGTSAVRQTGESFFRKMPTFLYVLAFYLFISAIPFVEWRDGIYLGNYGVSVVEVFYVGAIGAVLYETLRVSIPGKNNSPEVNRMLFAAVIMTTLLVAGVVLNVLLALGMLDHGNKIIVWTSRTFSNTQFLTLVAINWAAIPVMNTLNGRTAQRGIGVAPLGHDDQS